MNNKVKPTNKFLNILFLSCIFFTPASIVINLFSYFFLGGRLMHAWASFFVFCVAFIVSSILVVKKNADIKNFIIRASASIYTIISFLLNLFVFIIMDGSLWKIQSILLIIAYALIVALLMKYMTVKSYLIKSLVYYAISIIFFLILTVSIAKYNSGNTVVIIFIVFSAVFILFSVLLFYIKRTFFKYENEEKAYKKQFD